MKDKTSHHPEDAEKEHKEEVTSRLGIVRNDPYLEPCANTIRGRHEHAMVTQRRLTQNGKLTLSKLASGHHYFGLRPAAKGWVSREWAPHATAIYLVGDFSSWEERSEYAVKRIEGTDNQELMMDKTSIHHGGLYKMHVYWEGGQDERIPAWVNRVIQDNHTKIFSTQIWCPEEPYAWKTTDFKASRDPLFVYECRIGMVQDAEKVGTYTEFKNYVLPCIMKAGYNCIQIMAIQEHPYYGSFGYHVGSFFAASSRFGTSGGLKELIDAAHQQGVAVIMDIIYSHAVKNELEGLGNLTGDPNQYFCSSDRRGHPAWDGLCFNYGKDEVMYFLLSSCKYWLEEFHFDRFRFDGVTSMFYYSHGLGKAPTNYSDYYNDHQDGNAICYLTLADQVIHEVNPDAITIVEEVNGMPDLAAKVKDGGLGFDYRMPMNIPDFQVRTVKKLKDGDWKPSSIFWEIKSRRSGEQTTSYHESHDQALIGDKTTIFRLINADVYWHFKKGDKDALVHRGIALHKMIRLVTASTMNGGYLNFMSNEFGHPEWIDFPREGNGWNHKYARRQWNLVSNQELDYHCLGNFGRAMIDLLKSQKGFNKTAIQEIWHYDGDQTLCYTHGDSAFMFNFSPFQLFVDYGFLAPAESYQVVLNTDNPEFGGHGLTDNSVERLTSLDPLYEEANKGWPKLYIPARSAMILKKR